MRYRRFAVVMLHPACDLRCLFCITEPFPSLDYAGAVSLLERLRREGVRHVVLGGGEPLLWTGGPFRLTRAAKGMGFHVQIGTAGIHLPEGFERIRTVDRWVLPLEASDPEIHDRLRPWRGGSHHRLILDRLEPLRSAGRPVTVSTVVNRENAEGIGGIGRFLEGYRSRGGCLHAWHLYRFVPRGRGGGVHTRRLDLPHHIYEAICDRIRRDHPGLRVVKRSDLYRSRAVSFHPTPEGAGGTRFA